MRKEEVEEDGEGQIEVEGEDVEIKERRTCMTMNVDEMRLKNAFSHEVHVTRHQKKDEDYALSVHAHRLCNLRVSVFVSLYLLLMWCVSCLSSVLVLYSYSFRSQFSVVGGILFTHTVGDSKLRWLLPNFDHCNFCTKFIVRLIPQVNRRFTDFRRFPRSISVKSVVVVMSQMRDATKNLAIATKMRKSFATNFGNKLDPLLS